jgi:hypothetical protein
MNYGFPDWMFAAIAIGVWELCEYLSRKFHVPHVQEVAYVIALVCAICVVIRYILRFIHHRKNPPTVDPDEWKNY